MTKLLIVGNGARFHVGAIFYHTAQAIGISAHLLDVRQTKRDNWFNWIMTRINWHFRDRRPVRMQAFNQLLIETARAERPDILLVTGMLPPDRATLQTLREMGIHCVNFLTDDPWNPSHRASWVLDALPLYSAVFSPRYANIADLERLGCTTRYLPFAYDPEIHFREMPPPEMVERYTCDILFYGGADRDRLPYINALIDAEFNLHLYGGYWNRYAKTRPYWKGMADIQTLRWAVSTAKVSLCLVRRANRDGHVMRTFEVPAMGGCMLTEHTDEQRAFFGEDGERVLYFQTYDSMVQKVAELLRDNIFRQQLADRAYKHITMGQHTYADRLVQVLHFVDSL